MRGVRFVLKLLAILTVACVAIASAPERRPMTYRVVPLSIIKPGQIEYLRSVVETGKVVGFSVDSDGNVVGITTPYEEVNERYQIIDDLRREAEAIRRAIGNDDR